MSRRQALLCLAAVIAALDGAWLLHRIHSVDTTLGGTEWTLLMPALEAYQKANPDNFLSSSHSWDERLPPAAVITDPDLIGESPLFEKLLRCRPAGVFYINQSAIDSELQMPPRYLITGQSHAEALGRCVRATLPNGFVAEERVY